MKTRFYVILIILSIVAIFSSLMMKPALNDLQKSYTLGKTLHDISKEVERTRAEYSYDTSQGYKFYPGGQEKFDEAYKGIMERRSNLYDSADTFTNYFSNLGKVQKVEFIASKAIAVMFYAISIAFAVWFWIVYAIKSVKKKIRMSKKMRRTGAST